MLFIQSINEISISPNLAWITKLSLFIACEIESRVQLFFRISPPIQALRRRINRRIYCSLLGLTIWQRLLLQLKSPWNLLDRKRRMSKLNGSMQGKLPSRLLFPTFITSKLLQFDRDLGTFPRKLLLLTSKVCWPHSLENWSGITPLILFPLRLSTTTRFFLLGKKVCDTSTTRPRRTETIQEIEEVPTSFDAPPDCDTVERGRKGHQVATTKAASSTPSQVRGVCPSLNRISSYFNIILF